MIKNSVLNYYPEENMKKSSGIIFILLYLNIVISLKGTIDVISRDSLFKEGHVH